MDVLSVDDGFGRSVNHEMVLTLSRRLGRRLEPDASYLGELFENDDEFMLDTIDFFLGFVELAPDEDLRDDLAQLERTLAEGRSAYTIAASADGHAELQTRLPETVADAGREAMSPKDRAAEHLRAAWSGAYGRGPDPNSAYDHAVKAVEAAGKPTVSPSNDVTTLGTMIRDMSQKPSKWVTAIDAENDVERIIGMMALLWGGRYGHGDDSKPVTVDQAAAEMAVHLAVTLVQLFRSGAIRNV